MTAECALLLRDLRCDSLAREADTTRRVIAAIPEGGRHYRPDPASRTALELAWHLVASEVAFLRGIAALHFGAAQESAPPATVAEVLALYEREFPAALAGVRALTAEQLLTPVDFFGAFRHPAVAYLGLVENHSVHHRGQLSAYLRAAGGKVPAIYGGSADEPWSPPA